MLLSADPMALLVHHSYGGEVAGQLAVGSNSISKDC